MSRLLATLRMTVAKLNDEQLVRSIPLSASSELRARLYTFNDVRRADLRLFALSKKSGEWLPTRRGVSVPAEQLSELLAAVQTLVEADEKN